MWTEVQYAYQPTSAFIQLNQRGGLRTTLHVTTEVLRISDDTWQDDDSERFLVNTTIASYWSTLLSHIRYLYKVISVIRVCLDGIWWRNDNTRDYQLEKGFPTWVRCLISTTSNLWLERNSSSILAQSFRRWDQNSFENKLYIFW